VSNKFLQKSSISYNFADMSLFSNALARAIEELGEPQNAFAQRAGLDPRTLNKYVRGRIDCGPANIQIIVRQLPNKQRADVLTAWLRDMIPEVGAGLVSILPNDTARAADLDFPTPMLQRDLREAVNYLVEQAQRYTAIADLLIDLASALRGEHKA
jgi:transcriptional regulator with XRE-family HTH domain